MTPPLQTECRTCRSVTGSDPITPAPRIHEGQAWVIEHAYPVAHRGWLVIVLRRHAVALHDLAPAEMAELGDLLGRTTRTLRRHFGCEKEYIACFAEAPGFQHVHVHVVQRPADLLDADQGPRIFARLKPQPDAAVPPDEIAALSTALRAAFAAEGAGTAPARP